MKRMVFAIVFAGLLGAAALVVAADSRQSKDQTQTVDTSAMQAQVEALLAMTGKERRAALQQMNPVERRGLWLEARRTLARQRGEELGRAENYTNPKTVARHEPRGKSVSRAPGSITYDDGMHSTSFNGGSIIGNRFDTHTGLTVFASGTVSTVVAVVVQGSAFTTSSAGFVLEGPQTGGGGAFAIFSTFTGATGTTDTVTFSGIGANYTGSSFFVLFGDFNNSYVPAFGTGTTMGQGHHGVAGVTGGMGPNVTAINPLTTLNALIRATGNIVPVELMKFDVE